MFLKGGNWTLKCNMEQISREYLQSDQVVNFHYWLINFIYIRLCGWVSIQIKEFVGVCQIWHSLFKGIGLERDFHTLKPIKRVGAPPGHLICSSTFFPSDKMKILVSICFCFSIFWWWLPAEDVCIQYVLDFRVLRQALHMLLSSCDWIKDVFVRNSVE